MRREYTPKNNIKRNYLCGYLTVYTALSMMILLSLCLTLIEGARRNTIRLEAECIMDIALNSVLAEYHRELYQQYNLLFIDTSYGSGVPSYYSTAAHLLEYANKNMRTDDIFLSGFLYRDILAMSAASAEVSKVSVATDLNGGIFRERAVEAIKNDVGITYLEEVVKWLDVVELNDLSGRNIREEKESVDASIQEYDGEEVLISESEWTAVEINNPTKNLDQKRSAPILSLVVADNSSLSRAAADLSALYSTRQGNGTVNRGSLKTEQGDEGVIEKLLFQEYMLRYAGYYGKELDKSLLKYQIEYLIAGKDNDQDNLESVVNQISALREVANAVYLFSDSEKCALAEAVAAALAAAIFLPEIAPLLQAAIILGWAYAESLYDIKVLLAGGKVPLLKTAENWHYDISCVFEETAAEDVESGEMGLSYQDYLRILLMLQNTETVNYRFFDIVEMDIRITKGNAAFRLDGCIDGMEALLNIESAYGYQCVITRQKEYY